MFKLKSKQKGNENYTSKIITENKNFSIIEAYKAIRANLNFAITNPGCKKIMICSSYSGEGKTTTCVNLAITIAETNSSVLLIDCDLRKSRIHKMLDLDNEIGISAYLSNRAELTDVIKETTIPNLNVITSGKTPPNPAELLSNGKMEELFKICGHIADYIILDTPPLCVVSDALPLSKKCDGVILVVQHMKTTHPGIKEAISKLKFAEANIAGMILNDIKINGNYKSFQKYGKYYKNSYAYRENDEKENMKDG